MEIGHIQPAVQAALNNAATATIIFETAQGSLGPNSSLQGILASDIAKIQELSGKGGTHSERIKSSPTPGMRCSVRTRPWQ